jgi:hypothetical protein
MKAIPASDPTKRQMASRLMVELGLAAMLAAVFFAVGCKKSEIATVETPPSVADTNQSPAVIQQTPPSASAPVVVAARPDGGADLKQLNHAYIGWILQNRRRPKSFEEFVTLSGIQVPPPPAGKKYVIDGHGFINYVNN